MTPTITRRSLVTITAAAIAGLTLILLAVAMTTAQDITTWATPVPVTPDVPAQVIDALVRAIVAILRSIIAELIGARG